MNAALSKLLRRSLYFLLLVLATLVILASIFLSQLDLDDYRHELEQGLGEALEQPVQIGFSTLTFHKGIALRFKDLKIGPEQALLAEVPHFTARLRMAPLFSGQIILDRVEIDNPRFQLWLPIQNRPEKGTAHRLTDQFGIRLLQVNDASLTIHQRLREGSRELLQIDNFDTRLLGWQANQTAELILAGQLKQGEQRADFHLDVTLPSSTTPGTWRSEDVSYQLQINNLVADPRLSGKQKVDVSASIQGTPAEQARIKARVVGSTSRKQIFQLSGRWNSTAAQETVSELSGQLFGLPLQGELYILRQEQQQLLAGRFGTGNIKLTRQLLTDWQVPGGEKLLDGTLDKLFLVLEKTWPADQPFEGLPDIKAEVTISDLEWQDNSLRRIEDFSAELALQQQQLDVQDGLVVVAGQPVFFSGRIEQLFDRPRLNLKVELLAQLADLVEPIKLPQQWRLTGKLPTTLSLTGDLKAPGFQLVADLKDSELLLDQLLRKPAGQNGSLLLQGSLNAEHIQLDRLQLQLPGTTITGNGLFDHDPDSDYFLLDIDPLELDSLKSLSPLLNKLQLQGSIHPRLERSATGLRSRLLINNVGLHLNNIVGDLNGASGAIDIDRQGLQFSDLQASFGSSTFLLNGRLDDWQKPQLELQLKSAEVRANDLIFPNPELRLYDLDGRLQIDKKGIRFAPVKVRLEQATEAIVTGSLEDFSAPQVTLDIEAENANIDQVIALFIGPRKRTGKREKTGHKPVLITARAKQGTIGELQFQNAEGQIRDHNGVFTLFPLRFNSGEGFCLARVEFDRNRKDGLLKISGHAEGINASVLHQDLFKDRGLINGSLRGDFYLEGSLSGTSFWHNASGGIHLQISDGTLRKFRGLARVFSLLNVSQLFAGKLPDMDREGMPFTLLEGSFRIADGRAKTEDLKITSEAMNMSLIGSQSLIDDTVNFNLGVMPLRTVDKVITSIPIAGWILAGENQALLTAHFRIEGPSSSPKVSAVPINTVSDTVFGIFKRTLGLPGKLVKDIGAVFEKKPEKKKEPTD